MLGKIKGRYSPRDFESKIYSFWLERKYFHSDVNHSKPMFSIVIPPPNITGYLHIGHALNNTLQDVIVRYKRMKGFNTTWIPGTDHAGIATQNVVERELERQGITRFELGRERFVREVWKWKEKYGSRIVSQLKSLGCSCDWDRQRFTLDEDYCRAVTREFVSLYNDGLIYRGNYMINWCPRCRTAISDIEVDHVEKKGFLWDIKYPLIEEGGEEHKGKPSNSEFIVVSTTRPETMLGDTAVAVNPADPRYKKYKNRYAYLPLVGRRIPIIEDRFVDMEFGSGAVKVTPAHDPNDFEMGKRHHLEEINIFNEDATLNENAGPYRGLDRFKAREKILKELEEQGYLLGKKDHVSSVGVCSRCNTIIEPRISMQWFVSTKKLAAPAILAVKEGRVRIIPKKWEKIYFDWMENIRDWCISRQLWWGHRIPVWYCDGCGEMIVAESTPSRCSRCGGGSIRQEEDVLDTWFSSCLWPFATLGWPEETPELKYYFPTSLLITGHDIIFFWVARMIMMSLYFMKDVPFRKVFINPLVNDASGQKMSKSKGNIIDPIEIIDKYGADSLRFTLTSLTTPGKNLLLGEEKIEGMRNFANKLWNASIFVISSIAGNEEEIKDLDLESEDLNLNIWDRWILSRLNKTIRKLEEYLEKYSFSFASRILYDFFWSEYCDWYIESSKLRIYSSEDEKDRRTAMFVLWYVLETYLRLLHPFMPFVTERIWQEIPHHGESIMVSSFPSFDVKRVDDGVEQQIEVLFDVISHIRKIRSELGINPQVKTKAGFLTVDTSKRNFIHRYKDYICGLARLESIEFGDFSKAKGYVKDTIGDVDIYVYLLGVIDVELELKRILNELRKVEDDLERSRKKVSNPQFLEKAPREVIKKEEQKIAKFEKLLKTLNEQFEKIESIRK
ncbi:MAG: valine--tRNA ligase [Actinobacteria bacterium]|nr:valine--tRNA ligase [Actinomycetota bacterium]